MESAHALDSFGAQARRVTGYSFYAQLDNGLLLRLTFDPDILPIMVVEEMEGASPIDAEIVYGTSGLENKWQGSPVENILCGQGYMTPVVYMVLQCGLVVYVDAHTHGDQSIFVESSRCLRSEEADLTDYWDSPAVRRALDSA